MSAPKTVNNTGKAKNNEIKNLARPPESLKSH